MERLGRPLRPASSQYQRLGRSESLDRLLGSAAWVNEIEPAARESQHAQPPPHQQQQQGRGRLLRSRSLPDLLGLRRRAVHWKALSWFLDPTSRRKVGSLEYLKGNRGDALSSGQGTREGARRSCNTVAGSKSKEGGGDDDKHRRKDRRQKQQKIKKRSSWLPDPDRRWPIQGW